jgi:histidinol dehydrogenase
MTSPVAKALRLNTTDSDFEAAFQKRLHWSADADEAIESRVAEILADVKQGGDLAVLAYTERFDGLKANSMQELVLTQAELKAAFESLPGVQRDALQAAAKRVRS